MISRRCFVLVGVAALVSTGGIAAVQVAKGTEEHVVLKGGVTRVVLRPTDGIDLAERLANLEGRRFTLVLGGLAADRQPGTPYLVFLNLPEGAETSPSDPGFAGTLSFFGVPRNTGGDSPRTISYEISDVLARLRQAGRLERQLSVTIVPGRPPISDSHPIIEKITLVEL
jgi:hypothetical protein